MTHQLGWLDTNLFVAVLFPRDRNYPRCAALFAELERGEAEGWIDPTVVHELTYVLMRTGRFPGREAIHDYVRSVLLLTGVRAHEKEALLDAIARWQIHGVGFVDAWLAVRARRDHLPVCSVNTRDFTDMVNSFDSPQPDTER
jgi:predicted nucleic acid-binding protein